MTKEPNRLLLLLSLAVSCLWSLPLLGQDSSGGDAPGVVEAILLRMGEQRELLYQELLKARAELDLYLFELAKAEREGNAESVGHLTEDYLDLMARVEGLERLVSLYHAEVEPEPDPDDGTFPDPPEPDDPPPVDPGPDPTPEAGLTFDELCDPERGVVFCDPMDTEGPWGLDRNGVWRVMPNADGTHGIPAVGGKGRSWRYVTNAFADRDETGRVPYPTVDADVKASGTGSLRFVMVGKTPQAGAGWYWSGMSDDLGNVFYPEGEPQRTFDRWNEEREATRDPETGAYTMVESPWDSGHSPGRGNEFFIRYKIRRDCAFVYEDCDPTGNGSVVRQWRSRSKLSTYDPIDITVGQGKTEPKHGIFGTELRGYGLRDDGTRVGFGSPTQQGVWNSSGLCDAREIVVNEKWRAVKAYRSCRTYTGMSENIGRVAGSVQIEYQNQRNCWRIPNPETGELWTKDSMGPNCFLMEPNEWVTIEIGVTLGPWQQGRSRDLEARGDTTPKSRFRIWAAHEGQPLELLHDTMFFADTNGVSAEDYPSEMVRGVKYPDPRGYGFFNLGPYMTNKDIYWDHPDATTWYDEVIVSTEFIPN